VETEEPFGTPFHNERFRYGTAGHGMQVQVEFCMCLFGPEYYSIDNQQTQPPAPKGYSVSLGVGR
jgi:hypothetical protein